MTGRSTRTPSGIAPRGVLVSARGAAQCHRLPVNSDDRCFVDYGRLPVSALLRGPLLHTPQGLVVLAWTGAYLLAALVAYLYGWTFWQGKFKLGFIALCFAWPALIFVMFIRDNRWEFERSWRKATWLVIYGALPLLFRAYDEWRT
jgi:hypothetical protein